MRRPTRPSRPSRSERTRERSEPSERPEVFSGIGTRRPSVVTTTATWRRFRPSNRPNAVSRALPGDPGRFAQSTRRIPILQPPRADGVAELHLGPMESQGSSSGLGGPTASSLSQIRGNLNCRERRNRRMIRRLRVPPTPWAESRYFIQRCPASSTRAELATAETATRSRKA